MPNERSCWITWRLRSDAWRHLRISVHFYVLSGFPLRFLCFFCALWFPFPLSVSPFRSPCLLCALCVSSALPMLLLCSLFSLSVLCISFPLPMSPLCSLCLLCVLCVAPMIPLYKRVTMHLASLAPQQLAHPACCT